MSVIDSCKEREPRVIDNALIQKCIHLQYSKGEVGRLVRLEGIPLDELEEIRFEFLNIIKIDHLWVLTALTKLQMNNNFIEKIENLETLVHLRELDLSFNKINKIENLDELQNLQKLSFFENHIETIENLDNQKRLMIFSIGRNRIAEREDVHYLRKFKKLASLNMAHNPCAEDKKFRLYIAAFLPQLVYYEYKRIDDSEKEEGNALFEETLTKLQLVEDEKNAKIAFIEQEKADAEVYALSFVEYLNSRHLFDQLFEDDEEGKAILDLGEEVEEYYAQYEEQFIKLCQQVFEVGQKHYAIRTAEIEQFLNTVETAKKESQEESISHMEVFMERKAKIYEEVKMLQKKLEAEDIGDLEYDDRVEEDAAEFNDLIHGLWKKLMKLELELYEQMEEVNQNFGHVLTDMINAFLEEAQAVFANVRAQEVTYMENIGDAAGRFLTNLTLQDDLVVPKSLEYIMSDREILTNAVGTTHDRHMQIIDGREDTLVNRAKNCVEHFTTNLVLEEVKRNRDKVLEINHFLDIQREEFEDLLAEADVNIDIDELGLEDLL